MCFKITEFPYITLGGRPRPFVPVKIHYKRGTETVIALLDSGADFTFVPLYIASRIGLKLNPKKIQKVFGIGGSVNCYKTEATLIFDMAEGEFPLTRANVLVPEKKDFGYTLLGRDTIFPHYKITFDELGSKVILERRYE